MQEKVVFLETALEYSASACKDFKIFWSHYSNDTSSFPEVQSFFLSSLETLKTGLAHLENHPFTEKQDPKIRSLLDKAHHVFAAFEVKELDKASWSSSKETVQFTAYFHLLKKFQAILNHLITQEFDYFLDHSTWKKLQKIHPDRYTQFYDWSFFLFFRMRRGLPWIFLLILLALSISVGLQINSLFVPYRAPGVIWGYLSDNEFYQIGTFQVVGNGKIQQVKIPLSNVAAVNKLAIALDIRPGHTLEVDTIRFIGKQKAIIQEYDFHTSHKQEWDVINSELSREYQVYEEGIAEIEKWSLDPNFAVQLPKDIQKQLSILKGSRFKNRDQFHQALEDIMVPKPNRTQKKLLRKTFQRPTVQQAYFDSKEIVLLSPAIHPNQIEAVEFHAQIHFPF